jgi:GNAT superfamily N-acetyltransferase
LSIRVEVVPKAQTPAHLRDEINRWYRRVFPDVNAQGIDTSGRQWAEGDYRVLAWHDDMWGGIVEVLRREILVGGQRVKVGGVGGVMTLPHMRGRGLAKAAMRRTADFICGELDAAAGMLYCLDEMVPFYAALGWQVLNRPITYQQGGETHMFEMQDTGDNAMILPCGDFVFPAGEVNIQGSLW